MIKPVPTPEIWSAVGSLKTYVSFYNYLRGQYEAGDLSESVLANVQDLLPKVNRLLNIVDGLGDVAAKDLPLVAGISPVQAPKLTKVTVTSGYRDPAHNKQIGGAKASAHLLGKAVDLADPGNRIGLFLHADYLRHKENSVLALCDLWLESPKATPGWLHVDTRPRLLRVFVP